MNIQSQYRFAYTLSAIGLVMLFVFFMRQGSSQFADSSNGSQLAAVEGAGSNLVGWWKLDDASGASAVDSSATGNSGSLTGSPIPTWTTGQANGAIHFTDGGYVQIPHNSAYDVGAGDFAVSLWYKTSGSSGSGQEAYETLFSKDDGSGNGIFIIDRGPNSSAGPNTISAYVHGVNLVSSASINDNAWHFIVLERSSGTASLLIDGQAQDSKAASGNTDISNQAIYLGLEMTGPWFALGNEDDARFYSRALSGSEISQLYSDGQNAPSSGSNPPPSNPPPSSGGVTSNPAKYIAESAAGSADASSCANAEPVSWFNSSANWGNGATQIGPGDTIHLCGTISDPLIIQGSGTSGNPITLYFESGAKLSKPTWGINSSAAIFAQNVSYVTIDGGTDGIIENTANGTALAEQQTSVGVLGFGLQHVTVQNLTIRHMYVRTPGSSDPNRYGEGIDLTGSYLLVQNNHVFDTDTSIAVGILASDSGNIQVIGNTCTNQNHALNFNIGQSNAAASNITFANNTLSGFDVWDGASGNHLDGLIWLDESASRGTVSNVSIYGNKIEQRGHFFTTSAIFIDTYFNSQISNLKIYDNLFTMLGGGSWSGGPISIGAGTNVLVANNTTYVDTPYANGGPGGFGILTAGNSTGGHIPQNMTIENNLAINATHGIYLGGAPTGALIGSNLAVDHNAYYDFTGLGSTFGVPGNQQYTPTDWQGLGYDIHSTTASLPALDPSFVPLSSDTVVHGQGVNLSNYFTSDAAGNQRPSSGAWDIGAYQYCGSNCIVVVPPVTPPVTPPVIPSGGGGGGGGGGGSAPVAGISNIKAFAVGTTGMTITWSTSQLSNGQVMYGLTAGYGSQTQLFSTLSLSHSVTIAGLAPKTTYHYKIVSGGISSADYTFVTGQSSAPLVVTTPIVSNASATSISGSITTWLLLGTTNSQVKTLQQILNASGFTVSSSGVGSRGNETTYFGPATDAALKKFQCAKLQVCSGGAYTTGYGATGPKTRTALNALAADSTSVVPAQIAPAASQTPVVSTARLGSITAWLLLGATNPQVKTLQQVLNAEGFTVSASGTGSVGHESTYFGPATDVALKRFQCSKLAVCSGGAYTTGYGATGPKTRAILGN